MYVNALNAGHIKYLSSFLTGAVVVESVRGVYCIVVHALFYIYSCCTGIV